MGFASLKKVGLSTKDGIRSYAGGIASLNPAYLLSFLRDEKPIIIWKLYHAKSR
jgi:hypothetical protein